MLLATSANRGVSMNVREWDALAKTFADEVCDIVRLDRHDLIGSTLARHGFREDFGTALDAGCGVGTFALRHASRFRRVTAIDSSPKLLERARLRCAQLKNVQWQCAGIDEFARSLKSTFDAIVCFNVVTATSSTRRARTMRALVKMLQPKGLLLLVVPSLESINFVRGVARGRWTRRFPPITSAGIVDTDGFRQKYYSVADLRSAVSAAAGRVLELSPITYTWTSEGLPSPQGVCRQEPWDWLCVVSRAHP